LASVLFVLSDLLLFCIILTTLSRTQVECFNVMTVVPKLRVARPSDNIDALLRFYCDGLGLSILSRFADHNGFDGVMLGSPSASYHFEFTTARGHTAGRAPTQENLLIFYMPDHGEWKCAVARMEAAGFRPVSSFNPYWDVNGLTYEDADGWRVVLQHSAWKL
jgi:catechol 2,3-dioxygenase-like lactoylglutathione lyase family enzyme